MCIILLGEYYMGINNTQNNNRESVESSKLDEPIQVLATISCPNCGYKKKFRNQFLRKDLELLIVAVKVFEWLTCNKCGDLLKLDLDFNF